MASIRAPIPFLRAGPSAPRTRASLVGAEDWPGDPAQRVLHGEFPFLRGGERKLVGRIRQLRSELTTVDWSDLHLQEAVQGYKSEIACAPSSKPNPERTALVFALVDECIRRRLGAWRQVAELRGRSQSKGLSPTDEAALEGIESLLEARVDAAGVEYLVPAFFYRTLRSLDSSGRFSFIPTDEQLLAGLHLLKGRVVEMQAGEGKTVAIAFAAVMNAVLGRPVHIFTANDYLAQRDSSLLAPVYRSLGFSVGAVLEPMDGLERKLAYECDVVYGTLREFGFDYLRDNLAARAEDRVQPSPVSAIVDEADQALIDEGDTPLIISGPSVGRSDPCRKINKAVTELVALQGDLAQQYDRQLQESAPDSRDYALLLCLGMLADPRSVEFRRLSWRYPEACRRGMAMLYSDGGDSPDYALVSDLYFIADIDRNYVTLTERGVAWLEIRLGAFGPELPGPDGAVAAGGSLSRKEARKLDLATRVYQSLRAHLLLEKGIDYLVEEDSITLLDAHTGRIKPDNLYQEGLQSALEAKEGVQSNGDGETLAQISVPGFASHYKFLAGITGTALVAGEEFRRRFSLAPVSVPPSQTSQRLDLPSRIYDNDSDRMAALVEEVAECLSLGRPVLVGVQTIEQSLRVSRALAAAGLEHNTLNAVTGHAEADIIRSAGSFGALTVATNMAGRGTDIVLNPELQEQVVHECIALVGQRLERVSRTVVVLCNSNAELEILEAELAASSDLQARRTTRDSPGLIVSRQGAERIGVAKDNGCSEIRFGLGLHVISAEFSRFPRVSLQLQGRSGRQGNFGSTRRLLCWDDRGLLPPGQGRPDLRRTSKVDSRGRVYYEGPAVDHYLRRRQEAEELEAAHRRSIVGDYAAVSDAHAEYYRVMRRQVLENPPAIGDILSLAPYAATRLVHKHFPRMDLVDYGRQFRNFSRDVCESYELDVGRLLGVSLDQLPAELAAEIQSAVTTLGERLGDDTFGRLAGQLLLEAGDRMWQDHQRTLRYSVFNSAAVSQGHKSSVADYIIHAAEAREGLQAMVNDELLSGLLTFPPDMLDQENPAILKDKCFDHEVSRLLNRGCKLKPAPYSRTITPVENRENDDGAVSAKE